MSARSANLTLIVRAVVSLALLGVTAVVGSGFEIALGAVVGFWLREGEHLAATHRHDGPADPDPDA